MTSYLPDHVQRALQDRPRARWTRAISPAVSPYSPYGDYPTPRGQWALMWSPIVLWSVMAATAFQENKWELMLAGALMAWPVAIAALWRVPQELRRSRARSWELDETGETFLWEDPSKEWDYARWQSSVLVVWLRRLMAVGVPTLTILAVIESNDWVMLWLPISASLIVYTYRHLPTPLVRMRRFRRCGNCDAPDRSVGAARVCPRCTRVTNVVTMAAVPALRRRWRAF